MIETSFARFTHRNSFRITSSMSTFFITKFYLFFFLDNIYLTLKLRFCCTFKIIIIHHHIV